MNPVEDARSAASARQTELYGESWSDRLTRLMRGYELSQAKLAGVIGLSAPMLSQLISGQRLKISNPAVYGRIVDLEQALADPSFRTLAPQQRAQLLADTAASQPVLSTRLTTTEHTREAIRDDVLRHLAELGTPESLRAAAEVTRSAAPGLAAVLDEAARYPGSAPTP